MKTTHKNVRGVHIRVIQLKISHVLVAVGDWISFCYYSIGGC